MFLTLLDEKHLFVFLAPSRKSPSILLRFWLKHNYGRISAAGKKKTSEATDQKVSLAVP